MEFLNTNVTPPALSCSSAPRNNGNCSSHRHHGDGDERFLKACQQSAVAVPGSVAVDLRASPKSLQLELV